MIGQICSMAAVVGIISGRGVSIHKCHGSKLALYKLLICCNSLLNQLYLSNKTECFSYKGGCG